MTERAHLAIGSNLDERRTYLEAGLAAISALPDTSLAAVSHIYETPPLGSVAQPDFLNAVCAIDTLLPPQELLAAMLNIENNYLRQRRIHWGPRTLDLDLLLYGDRIIASDTLVLPHPQMNDRNFVLVPLCEIESGTQLLDVNVLTHHVPEPIITNFDVHLSYLLFIHSR